PERLAPGSSTATVGRRWPPRRASAPVIAIVALLVLASVALAVTIGLQGLGIVFVPTPPTPNVPTDALNTRSALGTRADMASAGAMLGAQLLVPTSLGPPAEVYLGRSINSGA